MTKNFRCKMFLCLLYMSQKMYFFLFEVLQNGRKKQEYSRMDHIIGGRESLRNLKWFSLFTTHYINFNLLKDSLPQILLGLFLNTLFQINIPVFLPVKLLLRLLEGVGEDFFLVILLQNALPETLIPEIYITVFL